MRYRKTKRKRERERERDVERKRVLYVSEIGIEREKTCREI